MKGEQASFGVAGNGGRRVSGTDSRDARPAEGSFEGIGIGHARHASLGSCTIPSMARADPPGCGNSKSAGQPNVRLVFRDLDLMRSSSRTWRRAATGGDGYPGASRLAGTCADAMLETLGSPNRR